MKKIIISLFSFLLCISIINASEVSLKSKRYILYNMNENIVLDAKKEHERTSIASLTKIMTVITAIENIDNLDKKVTITSDMVDHIAWDVMKFGFKKGEKVTYRDLLYAAILPSAADAVNALAISISGSEKAFVKKMNAKVNELGLKDTKFANVVGLYDKNNYSSAYDMAEILKYSLKNETFKKVFTTRKYKMTNGKTVRSTLVWYNDKMKEDISVIKGSKTGHIDESRFCFASIASANGVDYLFVTLNAQNAPDHIKDHLKEYKYFIDNYSYKDIVNKNDKILTLETKYSKEKYTDIYSGVQISKYLKNDFNKDDVVIQYEGIKKQSVFNQSKKLGHVKITYKDEVIYESDIFNNKEYSFDIFSFIKENKTMFIYIFCGLVALIGVFFVNKKMNYI